MAEKRVSVRLAAVGGKQVRADLEGVGDAGVKGFGCLAAEMERANARLAAFSTRVKIAVAVAVAAAAAAISDGLEIVLCWSPAMISCKAATVASSPVSGGTGLTPAALKAATAPPPVPSLAATTPMMSAPKRVT